MPELPPGALDLFRQLLGRAREVIEKRPIGVGTYVPEKIVPEGRFRTQFEHGTESNGDYAPSFRAKVEQRFGFPLNLPPEQRPVYGALRGVGPRDVYGSPPVFGTDNISHYGDWVFLLSPEAKARSSFTFGDSLREDWDRQPRLKRQNVYRFDQPLPQTALRELLASGRVGRGYDPEDQQAAIQLLNPNMMYDYVETQTPGPVRLNDVAAIVKRAPNRRLYFDDDSFSRAVEGRNQARRDLARRGIPVYDEQQVLTDDDLARHLQLKRRGGLVQRLRNSA